MLQRKKIVSLIILVSFPFILLAGGAKEESVDEVPKIVIYVNNGIAGATSSDTASDPEIIKQLQDWIKENTGVLVETIIPPVGEAEQKLNVLLASGSQLDAFWGSWPDYAAVDAIIPIKDLLGKYGQSIIKAWPTESVDGMTGSDRKIWGIPRMTPFMGNPLFVRADWCRKYGLDVPRTIDELEVVLKTFKQNQPAGSSTIPLLAEMVGKHGSSGIFSTFVGAFTEDGASNWIDSDGKLKPQELQPGYKDFVAKMNEWFEKGYIYPEFAALNRNKIRELIKAGKVGVNATWYSNITISHYKLNENIPEADYQFAVGGLEGPEGKAETILPTSTTGMLISSKCEHPEAVVKVMEFMYSDPANYQISDWGPEGVLWEWTDKSKLKYKTFGERKGYLRDFALALGLPMERAVSADNPQLEKHFGYLGVGNFSKTPDGLDYSRGKMPVDAGVIYDPKILDKEIPSLSDLQRLRDEEVIKFIIGARPLSEWDEFIQEMYDTGLDKWIEVHTRLYNEQK